MHTPNLARRTRSAARTLLLLTLAAFAAGPTFAQETPAAPSGWKMEREGSDAIYTPSDLPDGKIFRLIVKPPAALGGASLREWLEGRIQNDGAKLGKMGKLGVIHEAQRGILSTTQDFEDDTGRLLIVLYAAVPLADDKARFSMMIASPDTSLTQRYMKGALRMILAGVTKTSDADSGDAAEDEKRPEKPTPRTPSKAEVMRQQYTKRGAGLKPSQIEGIFQHTTMQMGVGGAFYMVYEPIIVLKDGTVYEDFDVPLEDFDADTARKLRPKAWSKWRKQDGQYQTLNSKGVWEKSGWLGPIPGAKPGQTLKGTFSSIGGGGNTAVGGGTMIVVSNSLTFFPDGRFTSDKAVGASSAEPQLDTSVVATSQSKNAGKYKLNGHVLELHYNDGRVDRRTFAFMDKNDTDAIYLNGVAYLDREKK